LDVKQEVIVVLDRVLSLRGRAQLLQAGSPLLGDIPELDSMAVTGVLAALEERFGFSIHDDEINGATFATLGTLVDFVETKLGS